MNFFPAIFFVLPSVTAARRYTFHAEWGMRMRILNAVIVRLSCRLAVCLCLLSFPSWLYTAAKSTPECSAAEQSTYPKASLTN